MNNNIINALELPAIFAKSQAEFWNDKYISKQMLKAHLDPQLEGASRTLDFIEKSVAWIKKVVTPKNYPLLLDIGCGPGIYAEKFTRVGYNVTGIDFSKRSIDYAKQSALHNKLDINYIYQDYLGMELHKSFDFATFIYCDYGALSRADRQTILNKIYHHIKPGGRLLLDVFSKKKYNDFNEKQTWNFSKDGGFWRADEYIEMKGFYKYSDNVTLELISIISDDKVTTYYLWNTYFTPESLIEEVENCGFKVCEVFSDVAGSSYSNESDTIAILLER